MITFKGHCKLKNIMKMHNHAPLKPTSPSNELKVIILNELSNEKKNSLPEIIPTTKQAHHG